MRDSLSPSLVEPRLYGFDALRLLSFFAILVFHSTYALWAPYGLNYVPSQNLIGHAFESYARVFAFGGFTVLFLSFFLFGFRGERSRKWSYLGWLLLGFAIVWTATVEQFPYWWDIYPFLICALGLVFVLRRLKIPPLGSAFVSGFLVSLPFWRLEPWIGIDGLKTVVTGLCTHRGDLGDWPLLPWIFYPTFAFSLGQLTRKYRSKLTTLYSVEILVWLVLLAVSAPQLSKYYVTPIGEEFGCYVFRRPFFEFWAQQVFVLFFVRLALLKAVNEYLRQMRLVRWMSLSAVNRHFFAVYFAHYPLIFAVAAVFKHFSLTFKPYALAVLVIATWFAVEVAAVVIRRILSNNNPYGQGST